MKRKEKGEGSEEGVGVRVGKEEKKRESSDDLPLLCVLTTSSSHLDLHTPSSLMVIPSVPCLSFLSPGLIRKQAIDFPPLFLLVYGRHQRTDIHKTIILRTLPHSTAAH